MDRIGVSKSIDVHKASASKGCIIYLQRVS